MTVIEVLLGFAMMIGVGIFCGYLGDILRGESWSRRSRGPTTVIRRPPPEPPVTHTPDAQPYPWRPWS